MKFLFVAYCMVSNESGNSLIGVYKRCIRIGLELRRQGHSVTVICPGRFGLQDPKILEAAAELTYIDLPLQAIFHSSSRYKSRYLRKVIRQYGPDIVVLGEAPLSGILLDAAIAAVELRVRTVILDNAYRPSLAAKFLKDHGGLADGVALMGPSSFQMADAPSHYCGVPPFIQPSGKAAVQNLLDLRPDGLWTVTVLGYEIKAEQLTFALLKAMPWLRCRFLLITPDTGAATERLASLPAHVRAKVIVVGMPDEDVLFEAIRRSRLAIGKMGFMQTVESLCLGTPFLGVFYRGCFPIWGLPVGVLRFVGQTSTTDASLLVCLRFLRLLFLGRLLMTRLHHGSFDGVATVCRFLSSLEGALRHSATTDAAQNGYALEHMQRALKAKYPARQIEVTWVRFGVLRSSLEGSIDVVIVGFRSRHREQVATLRGRRFAAPHAGGAVHSAERAESKSRVLYRSSDGTLVLEDSYGEDGLDRA